MEGVKMMLLAVAVALFVLFGGWAPYAEVEPRPVAVPVGVPAVEFLGQL